MVRRWLRILNPTDFGLPATVKYLCPQSHMQENGHTFTPETKTEFFRILREAEFPCPMEARPLYAGEGTVIGERPFKVVDGRVVEPRGGVWIGENVEIGGNTVVDRGIYGEFTEIHDGAKIDNLVHVAHSVVIGQRSIVVAGCVLGGWAEIGRDCWLSMGVKVLPHIKIGDGSFVGAGTVVNRDLPPNSFAYGVPMRIKGGACCMKKLEFQGTIAKCGVCGTDYGMKEDGTIVCLDPKPVA